MIDKMVHEKRQDPAKQTKKGKPQDTALKLSSEGT